MIIGLSGKIGSFDDLFLSLEYEMFELLNYNPYPKLESETELSTGLKK